MSIIHQQLTAEPAVDTDEESHLSASIDSSLIISTHPKKLDHDHKTWADFANDLTTASNQSLRNDQPPYKNSHILLLSWAQGSLDVSDEISDLSNIFVQHYGFSTEQYLIPSRQPQKSLKAKIETVIQLHGNQDDLLIVYYGGHAGVSSAGGTVFAARGHYNSPCLNWMPIQRLLRMAVCDVLVILDCCYAASAVRTLSAGETEVLAACGWEVEAEGVTDHSFTRSLIRNLRSHGSSSFTIGRLYQKLLGDPQKLVNTPVHRILSAGHRNIWLTPRNSLSTLQHSMEPSLAYSPGSLTSENTFSSPDDHTPATPDATANNKVNVLIAISLEGDAEVPDVRRARDWLTKNVPFEGIKEMRISAILPSNSVLMLMSLPVEIWTRLPETSAYRFIDFVKTNESGLKQGFFERLGSQNVLWMAPIHALYRSLWKVFSRNR